MRSRTIPTPTGTFRRTGASGPPLVRSCAQLLALAALCALAGAASSTGALASASGPYAMEILVDGAPVQEMEHEGRAYIEALAGREYSVRLTNRTGERVAVALSVDGLNSIDAHTTTSGAAAKWILDPWQSVTLDGWQTGASTARRFFFTSERRSYGAWLGSTKNLGLVTAAVFREKRPVPMPWSRQVVPGRLEGRDGRNAPEQGEQGARERELAQGAMGPEAQAPPPSAGSERDMRGDGARREPDAGAEANGLRAPAEKRAAKSALSDELAATGIGREVGHIVSRIAFDEEDAPATLLEVRYEYRDALVRLGVIARRPALRERLAERECARGFEDLGYAPDPYRLKDRR